MEEIKHDYPKYMEQKYECIRIWANKNGKAGTIINLLWHIYFDLNDKSLVMKIEEDLRNKGMYMCKCNISYSGKHWWEKTSVNSAI